MKLILSKKNKGFTLVESLVAISVLSLSILASFTAVQSGLQKSAYVKDQIIAFYLTQEAMEYIKNIRDENALKSLDGTPTNWMTGLLVTSGGASGPCDFGKVCSIDSPLKTATTCGNASVTTSPPNLCANLYQQTSTGLYGDTTSSGWTQSKFKREIQFESIAAEEVRVTISIRWTTRGTVHFFQTSQLLFNRQ